MDQQKLLEKIESFKKQVSVDIFTFHPVATESDVVFFEQKFGIELPKDMRWFVLNVANGISSIYPTSHIIIPIDFADYYYQEDEYNPAKPFGLTQRTLRWVDKEDIDEYPYPTTYDDKGDMYDLVFNGRIDLAGFGCGTVAFIYSSKWPRVRKRMD